MSSAAAKNRLLLDALGLARLAAEGGEEAAGIAERLHAAVLATPGLAPLAQALTGDLTRLIYRGVRGAFRLAGAGFGVAATLLDAETDDSTVSRGREIALAALNGVLGDRLAASGNPLALRLRLRSAGRSLTLERAALAAALPGCSDRIVVLVHGLCMSDLQWRRRDHDHGAALARDLGYTPLYLSYNSGLHISTNGRAFAEALEQLVAAWPVEIKALAIVGHSMGGLVARSACLVGEEAGHAWRNKLSQLIFLGTPHHGAPLEQIANWADVLIGATPYSAAFEALGKVRSAGVTDLRYGALRDEDWRGRDRFARTPDPRRPAPLPEDVACYAVAATTASSSGSATDRFGDGLVPIDSALGRCGDAENALDFPPDRQWIAFKTGHMDLLSATAVYRQIAAWLAQDD